MGLITTQTMNPRPQRVSMPARVNSPKPPPIYKPPRPRKRAK